MAFAVEQGKSYRLSLYARCDAGLKGSACRQPGKDTTARCWPGRRSRGIGIAWKKFACEPDRHRDRSLGPAGDQHGRHGLALARHGVALPERHL